MKTTRGLPHAATQGQFLVSDDGRVLDVWQPALLSQSGSHKQGYLRVSLRGRQRYVHQLVLEAHVGPRPRGMNVLHANDIPWDNRLENLRWGTQSENLKEATVNGRNVNANKTHCKNGHEFTPENTYLKASGSRECRVCSYQAKMAWQRKNRDKVS